MFKTNAAALLPGEPHSERGMGWESPNPHHAKIICMIPVQNVNYLFNLCDEVDTAK